MLKFYRRIKFENLVIFGGLIECLMIIVSVLWDFEAILIGCVFIQNIIFAYIIRRLFRIVETQGKAFQSYKCYNSLFFVLSAFNLLFFLSQIALYNIWRESKLAKGVNVLYHLFALSISAFMLLLGRDIKIHINYSLREDSVGKLQATSALNESEMYYGTRILQINVMIYTNFLCSLYQVIYYLLRELVYRNDHPGETRLLMETLCLHYIYLFSNLAITFFNYISFYFIIRNQFKTVRSKKPSIPSDAYTFELDTELLTYNGELKEIEKVLTNDSLNCALTKHRDSANQLYCRTESFESYD